MKPMDSVSYEELELNKAFGSGYKTYFEVKELSGDAIITEVQVIKETDKFIEISGLNGKWAKENSYSAFFPTREQCKSWLIDRVNEDIKKYEKLHRDAMKRRSKYLQL